MGLSSLPTPAEGMLTLLLVNTALVVSVLKEIARSVLDVLGVRLFPPAPDPAGSGSSSDRAPEPTLTDRFRSRFKPVRFGSAFGRRRQQAIDCRVCLARFEPESMVNRLHCGHLFHEACLERWLDYSHATCPLCRSHILPAAAAAAAASSSSPWVALCSAPLPVFYQERSSVVMTALLKWWEKLEAGAAAALQRN